MILITKFNSFLFRFQVFSISNASSTTDLFGTQGKVLNHLFSSKNLFDVMSEGPSRGPSDVLICPEQAGTVKNLLTAFNIPFKVKTENYQKYVGISMIENQGNFQILFIKLAHLFPEASRLIKQKMKRVSSSQEEQ